MGKDTRPTYKPNKFAREIIFHIRAAYPLHIGGVSDAINYALRFTSTNDPMIAERVEEEHREER
jgi:hypothetical protein